MQNIIVQPIAWSSSELESSSIVSSLIQHLSKLFGDMASIHSSRLQSSPPPPPSSSQSSAAITTMPPTYLYDKLRKQWISPRILDWLLLCNNPGTNTKVLAICNFDAYSDELNFVFGEAHLGGRVAAVYLPRLRDEFYIKKPNMKKLFEQRVIKEAVHELGHAFGLGHCENSKCVMHFSNSLQDTDFKDHKFCKRCNKRLKSSYMVWEWI
jgi:archaemetzincin